MADTRSEFRGFGYWRGCPTTAKVAWGARAILNKDGTFDLVPDRMDWNGELADLVAQRSTLADRINLAFPEIRETVRELVVTGVMRADTDREFVLFNEDKLKVVANTNGSHGYLYMVAFSPE